MRADNIRLIDAIWLGGMAGAKGDSDRKTANRFRQAVDLSSKGALRAQFVSPSPILPYGPLHSYSGKCELTGTELASSRALRLAEIKLRKARTGFEDAPL